MLLGSLEKGQTTNKENVQSIVPSHLKYYGYFSNESADGSGISYQVETNNHVTMVHTGSSVLWGEQLYNELNQARTDGLKVIVTVDGYLFDFVRNTFIPNPNAQANWDMFTQGLVNGGFINSQFPEQGTVVAFYVCDEPNLHGLNDDTRQGTRKINPVLKDAVDIIRNHPVTALMPISTIIAKGYGNITEGVKVFDWVGYDNYDFNSEGYLNEFRAFKAYMNLQPYQRTILVPLCCTLTWSSQLHSAEAMYNYAITDPSVIAIMPFIWRNPGVDVINSLREPPLASLRAEYEAVGRRIKNGS